MAKLTLVPKYPNINTNVSVKSKSIVLNLIDSIKITDVTVSEDLISTDPDNDLKYGSDGKLKVTTDELNTSFEYAASVSTFWSI